MDRTKVQELGLALTDVFDTLQVYLGSTYVNDFNLFGRTYSVYAQADAPYRSDVGDIERLRVRNERGEMVPLGSVVDIQPSYGPDPVIRYNAYPSADMSVGLNPAVLSSTDGLAKLTAMAEQILPRGMEIEWTGLTYQPDLNYCNNPPGTTLDTRVAMTVMTVTNASTVRSSRTSIQNGGCVSAMAPMK